MVGVSVEDAAVNVLLEGRTLLLEGRIPLLLWFAECTSEWVS